MKGQHFTDREIQEYAFEGSAYEPAVIEHLQSCVMCSMKVENYKKIFHGIMEQSTVGFDFDLSTLVTSQIAKTQVIKSHAGLFRLISIIVAIAAGLLVYLYGAYVSTLFSSISGMGLYLVITTASILLIFLGIDVYQKYERKLNMLDFY